MRHTHFDCRRDGLTIRGDIWWPNTGRHPVFILSHGFMANQSMCRNYAKSFADMGYAAVTFDFCGGGLFSKSDGKSVDMSILTEVQDLEAVLSWVKAQPFAEPDDISLLGCSQGGFVSALVAKKHPEIKQLVLLYPALCIPDDARAGKMLMFHFDSEHMPNILSRFPMKIGREYARAVMDWDFREEIKGYEGKTLLIHGTKDRIVDIQYAREAEKLFRDCHYYEIEGGTHGFIGKYNKEVITILENELSIDK